MTDFIQFAILGLCMGSLYALAALGVVLVHRGSGVINFAHGAVGVVGAYCFYELHDARDLNFFVAFIPSLLLCALVGLVIQFLIMKPLRNSSPLVHLLATLGVMTLIQGLLSLHYKEQALSVASSLPRGTVKLGAVNIPQDRLLILLIVLVITGVLAFVYSRTHFGRVTTAVAEDQRSAAYLGHSPNLVAGINWAVGSMLAGTAAILLAPITGLQTAQLTLLLVPALAAAVVGNMSSFPLTLAAGLVIGLAQTLLQRYANGHDWGAAVPFVLLLVVLSFRGRSLPDRSHVLFKMPAVGTGRIRVVPLIIALVVGVVLLQTLPVDWVDGITTTIAIGTLILSIVVVTGYGGQVSLVQFVLGGFGAWVAARLVAEYDFGFLPALIVGTLAALPLGIIVGLPAVRIRGANLAIITLAFGLAMEALLFNSKELAGGDVGLQVGFIKFLGFDIDAIMNPRNYAIFCMVMFTICALAVANLRRGKSGRRLLAVRSNERAAAASGVNVTLVKLYAFSLGAMIAAFGGILLMFRNTSVVFTNIGAFDSVTVLGYAVIGGLGYVVGPLFGGTLQPGAIGTNIGNFFSSDIQTYLLAFGGAMLIVVLLVAQNGLANLEARRWGPLLDKAGAKLSGLWKKSSPAETAEGVMAGPATAAKVAPRTLKVDDLSVTFGSVTALKGLSMEVRPGTVLGLIGPNGAGKTTAIDAITGFVSASSGRIHLDDVELTGKPARLRAEAGLSRSFQSLELFEDITVLENLLVVSESRSLSSYALDLVWPRKPKLTAAARAAVELLDLQEDLHRLPTELPYGRRRLVAIARAIAAEPSVLLLDEPAAGLSQSESAELRQLLRHLADERGMAVLLIEHDVDLVMASCDHVLALVFGEEIASGTPAEVRNDPKVVHAYLGEPEDDGHDLYAEAPEPAFDPTRAPGSHRAATNPKTKELL